MGYDRSRKEKNEVEALLLRHGLAWIGGEYKNSSSRLDMIDEFGYKYNYSLQHFYSKKKGRAKVVITNPHAIENIKQWLKNNNREEVLISDVFIGVTEQNLVIKCLKCDCNTVTSWRKISTTSAACKNCKPKEYSKLHLINKTKLIKGSFNVIDAIKDKRNRWKVIISCKDCQKTYRKNPWDVNESWKCPTCNCLVNRSSYNVANAKRHKEEWLLKPALVYFIKIYNEHESFYKIGITANTIRKRMSDIKKYKTEVIKVKPTNLYDAIFEERRLHLKNSSLKYLPTIKFNGYTECFSQILYGL